MYIKVPLTSPSEVIPLINAGATEFYAGLRIKRNIYSGTRPFKRSSFNDFGAFREAVQEAYKRNVHVALCCNSYFDKNRKHIMSSIEKVMKIGVRTFIVSNPSVVIDLRYIFPENSYVLSTLANCFNSYAVDFFEELGISSVILPRDLSLDEIKVIKEKKPYMNFVVIIHNIKCEFINGSCHLHRLSTSIPYQSHIATTLFYLTTGSQRDDCKTPYTINVFNKNKLIHVKRGVCLTDYRGLRCGACAIPFLNNISIYGIKIIGREFPFSKKLQDVKFISMVVNLSKKNPAISFNTIRNLYKEIYERECSVPHECHYPLRVM
jgi:hypothetical protein